MKLKSLVFTALAAMLSFAPSVQAQEDEVVVTGSRLSASPGIYLEKKGNYLLLEVQIENDSRGLDVRLQEITETVDNVIAAAEEDPSIELSIVGDGNMVRPLSQENFKSGIRAGGRPDTSIAFMKVKTAIPDNVGDSYKLATKLGSFVEGLEEVGRTEIKARDDIAVSVVNPFQYRKEVMDLIIDEVNDVTGKLGPDYRVILTGIDGELEWVRSGDLNLAFYLPYQYMVLPTSVNSIVDPDIIEEY